MSLINMRSACCFAVALLLVTACKHQPSTHTAVTVTGLNPAYSAYYDKGNFNEAFKLAAQARQTFNVQLKPAAEAEALLLMSDAAVMQGAVQQAAKLLGTASTYLKQAGNDSLLAGYHIIKGNIAAANLAVDSARYHYAKASSFINSHGFNSAALSARLNLSRIKLSGLLRTVNTTDSLLRLPDMVTAGKQANYFTALLLCEKIKAVNDNGSPDSAMRITSQLESSIKRFFPHNSFMNELLYSSYTGTAVNAMDYQQCINSAQKELLLARKQNNPVELFNAYLDMKDAYIYNQDLKRTLLFLDSAALIRESIYPERSLQASIINAAYGKAYRDTHDYEKAKYYVLKNIKLDSLMFGKDSKEIATDYISIANLFYLFGRYQTMVDYMKKGIAIREKIYKPDDLKVALALDDLARVYDNLEKPEIALPMQQKVERVYKKNYGPSHSYVAWAYDSEADSYGLLKQYDKAIEFNNKAFAVFIPEILKDSAALNQTARIPFDIYISDYFASRVLIYYNNYLNVKDKAEKIRLLKLAYFTANAANNYLRSYSDHYDSPESIAAAYQHMYDYYRLYTDVSAALFDLTGDVKYRASVLNYAENKRGSFIRSNILSSGSIAFSGMPASVLKQEAAIRHDVTASFAKTFPSNKRDSVNRVYAAFLQMLASRYPDYYKLKYRPYTISDTDVQRWLPGDNTAFAEYMLGKAHIYLIIITKNKSSLVELKKDDTLLSQISGLNALIRKAGPAAYYKSAYTIYKSLVQPMEPYIRAGSKVIISGDGELSTLSFEALVTRPQPAGSGYNAADFLFNRYNFSYAVSAFSLLNPFQKNRNVKEKEKVYYAAPGFDDALKSKYQAFIHKAQVQPDENYLSYLYQPFMLKLGNTLAASWDITKKEGVYATEADFKAEAPSNNVIQVGSHALLNDIDPMRSCLVFAKELSSAKNTEDGYLYSSEIYNQKLDADLVILTACETGGGKFKEGEGMMSLSYSFEYAGCKSAMMSLWPIDEKTSATITENFYKHLGKGETTGTALYNAKKDFLAAAEGPMLNPFYWSGLVMLGQDQVIRLDKRSSTAAYGWGLAAGSMLLLGAWRLRSYKRKQAA